MTTVRLPGSWVNCSTSGGTHNASPSAAEIANHFHSERFVSALAPLRYV